MRLPPKTLLCATDLSKTGDGAVSLAYALAGPGTTVHLVHVNEPAMVLSPLDATVLYMPPPDPVGLAAVEEKVGSHLRRLEPEGAATRKVKTEVHVLHESGVAAAIEREALRVGADVIVLGTRGRSGIAKAILGSVANTVMRQSKVPVALFHDVPS